MNATQSRPLLRIDNATARALWLDANLLSCTPTGPLDVLGTIRRLGLVQLDSIQVVARAHHHILWSRNQNYREPMLNTLLGRDRAVFEHFTHDASVLPMEMLPYWQRQFRRKRERYERAGWVKNMPDAAERARIRDRIAREGPLSSHAFDTRIDGPREMWSRPPHKHALDFMWYAGELATCHRDGFTKVYDLAERVFPAHLRETTVPDAEQVDWLCRAALDRLDLASPGDLQRFWDAVGSDEVRDWVAAHGAGLQSVEVQTAQGIWIPCLARTDIEDRLAALAPPTSRLRILNPFDPAIRDRKRLSRLFGFDYTVEMFVPAAKRVWGYYVFPILEGGRFVGRIEVRANRKTGVLSVHNFWPEPGLRWSVARFDKLRAELDRLRRFVGLERLVWDEGPKT